MFRLDLVCLPVIAMVGAVPAIVIVAMVRRGAPLTPRLTAFLGALAAAAAYVGLRLVHPQDAAFMVLVWQFGSVAVFASVIGLFGRWLLPWRRAAAEGSLTPTQVWKGRLVMLTPTQPVPPLAVSLVGGGRFDIAESRPEAFTLIAVYRGYHCPICRPWLGSLLAQSNSLAALGVAPIAISTDPEDGPCA